jgi:hypothetical protein
MKHKNQRYIQPQNVHDAMMTIEKLFNQYRHAPLTQELLSYHQNLIGRLQGDIYQEAVRENNAAQLAALTTMIQLMQSWTRTRITNQPFHAKMKHFKFAAENTVQFKRHVIKNNSTSGHRSSRH